MDHNFSNKYYQKKQRKATNKVSWEVWKTSWRRERIKAEYRRKQCKSLSGYKKRLVDCRKNCYKMWKIEDTS